MRNSAGWATQAASTRFVTVAEKILLPAVAQMHARPVFEGMGTIADIGGAMNG